MAVDEQTKEAAQIFLADYGYARAIVTSDREMIELDVLLAEFARSERRKGMEEILEKLALVSAVMAMDDPRRAGLESSEVAIRLHISELDKS